MSQKNGIVGMGAILERFIAPFSDVRCIFLSTTEGGELMAEYRGKGPPILEDSQIVSSLVPSFVVSIDQSSRLGLGPAKHSMTWVASSIVLQVWVESVVLSLVLEDTANIGLVEEQLGTLISVLRPFLSRDE
jgi:Mitogen-activated protein kinase kinase 1 interacting